MTDEKGNTPQDRRAVALSDPNERRHFIDQFVKDNPGTDREAVSNALDEAATKIAPSEDRNALKKALSETLGGKAQIDLQETEPEATGMVAGSFRVS